MKRLRNFLSTISIVIFIVSCATPYGNLSGGRNPASVDFPEYDRGPNPEDPMQKELVEILQDLPFVPGISEQLQVLIGNSRGQKMRPDFGGMPIRGFLEPNSLSVIVIGQDATHIAEGANRPGIAGFGGRVQDMLLHFGILEGVLFTNLYVNTIAGQYGSRMTPVVEDGKTIKYQNILENRLWLMTHEGPYGEWRNRFLSWIVRNNRDSLRMVMMLGQAGKDAGASFVNYLGGNVGARSNIGTGAQFDVPIFKIVGAGGNNEFAIPLTAKNEDVAEVLRKDKKVFSDLAQHIDTELKAAEEKVESAQEAYNTSNSKTDQRELQSAKDKLNVWKLRQQALDKPFDYRDGDFKTLQGVSTYLAEYILTKNPKLAIANMVFSNGGPHGNGVLRPEQFGGWDIKTMTVNGKPTRSIAGLQIPCAGSKVGPCASASSVPAPDVVFVGAPHPTALSMSEQQRPGSAAKSVEAELMAPLREELKRGWKAPQPEKGLESLFLAGNKPYQYGRGVIPPSHGDPGITAMRLLPVSTAQRDGSHMIIIGTRDGVKIDQARVKQMMVDTPSDARLLKSHNILTGRPRFTDWLYEYDRGPSKKFSDLLFKSLDQQAVLTPKAEFSKEYEEELKKKSAKAKTGEDFFEAYLDANSEIFEIYGIDAFDIKSHPEAGFFGHYRGTFENPKVFILADPHGYDSFITSKAATGARGQYLNGLMHDFGIGDQYLVISTIPAMMDGATDSEWETALEKTKKYRTDLVTSILELRPSVILADGKFAAQELRRLGVTFIEIKQDQDPAAGIKDAGKKIAALKKFKGTPSGERIDIPRSHLTWVARTWEGTSGDRVITALDRANKGKAFAIVAPDWARNAKTYFTAEEQKELQSMVDTLAKNGEPLPKEDVATFLKRRQSCKTELESGSKPTCRLSNPIAFPGVLPDTGSF